MTTQTVVGDYTLLARIGEGGMGVVHLARRPDGARVALKVLRPQVVGGDDGRARLAREVGSLRRVRSRWVAEIVDADPWGEVPYVATRYVPGLSLHDHVAEEGPIAGRDLDWFAACLAEGLASVHAAGVLHRDVKPSNVLMEGRTPILIDFGLARVADDPRLTHTGWLMGTPGYLAPEILYGDDATAASDVHCWAATVAFAGTGRAPFGRGPSMAVMDRVRRGEHDLSGLPADLRRVVRAALDPDPARRPSLDALLRWLRPRAGLTRGPVPDVPHEALTQPLMAAPSGGADEPTRRFADPAEEQDWDDEQDEAEWDPDEEAWDDPPAGTRRYTEHVPEQGLGRAEGEPWPWEEEQLEPVPRVSPGERLRRGLLLVGAGLVAAVAVAAFPWPAAATLLTAVWLLRSGSLAASAVGDRRRLRGRRWYDGVQLLVAAPWHLVRSIGGTLVLELWALGLAASAALVCYAVAAGVSATLFVSGVVLVASLWWGPGGSRVRSPLGRVVQPIARSGSSWVVGLLAVVALGGVLGLRLDADGTSWAPAQQRPFASYDVPDWPRR
ncbi:serine/threonine-protein kinase [Nocardioides ferulae]|uniref:serine/threonine-protein kinase n=1 Tax=Nocardioides ferulae TaxID=2340821 RepID=UPI000EAC3E3D|nr:serine/threonine-protein kinase [Nocardioides ferulae]